MLRVILIEHLDVVFFFYGLAFFTMGIIIFAHWRKESIFELADKLLLLAGFGIIHGINEWLDMCVLIKELPLNAWNSLRSIVLYLSFIFLFEFGRQLLFLNYKRFFNKWLTLVFGTLTLVLMFLFRENPGLWPRYFLGFPGGMLSSIGFLSYYNKNIDILRVFSIRRFFILAAISLGIYSILTGIVVSKSDFFPASLINQVSFLNLFGVPVQLIRALCAFLLTLSVWYILGIFNLEALYKLKRGLNEVTLAKAYIENIFKSVVDSLVVVNSNVKIEEVNDATCELLGYERGDLIGSSVRKIFGKNSPFQSKKLKDLIKNGILKDVEVICLSKNGENIPVLFSESVMRNAEGKIVGIVAVGKDLRELKKLQERLLHNEKLAAMGQTASIIGHEFKNRLGVMRNSVYFIKMKLPVAEEKVIKHLSMLEDEIGETNKIIEDILTFTRMMPPEFKGVDLKELLLHTLDKIQVSEKIKVTTRIESGLPRIQADAARLSSVFINIILNSFDAMKDGGELSISGEREKDFIKIVFRDTGVGIKAEEKKNIFEPFFTTKPRGTGLGLAIAKAIIEAHKGSIDIESEFGQGTSVIIKLPVEVIGA